MGVLGRVKMQQVIRDQGPEAHKAKSGTLTMGGVGFALAVPAALAVAGLLSSNTLLVALAAAWACALIGLADDLAKFIWKKSEGVKARYRFVLQLAFGAALGWYALRYVPQASSLHMPFGWSGLDLKWLFIPFAVFVFAGTLNAVNFTDGLDGLLGGCTLLAAAAFAIYFYRLGGPARDMVPLLVALAGAVAGFLWFNAHPAALFMGDTGSLFIGGLFGAVAILGRAELFLVVAGLLFVAEAMSVIIQVASFQLTGKRVFRMAPIHHHFEEAGWAETQVVARFWLVAGVFAAAGLAMFAR